MSADIVKSIIKSNHIFNNIVIASRPLIIKVSPKSNIAIIWLNIWDVQSSSNTKGLINRYFNIRSYIATIHRENMNPEILQCKNCQKQSHATFSYRIQGSRYVKCNSPHKSEYHHQFIWCYKTNFKTNSPRFKTKQDKLCLHTFKSANCKDDHQANLNLCSFWKY